MNIDFEKVKFGVEGPNAPWDTIKEIAVYCEKLGLDSYWMPDHLVATGVKRWDAIEVWGALGALAVLTEKIMIATGVSDTYRVHPAVLAQKATTIDIISNGRAILGIGIGEAMNLVPFGIEYDKPVGRTMEALEVIRRLLNEDFVDFEGKYYKLKQAFIAPKPVQKPHYPIYVAGASPRTIKMAGKYGDGWLPANLSVEKYKEGREIVMNAAKEVGKDPEKIDMAHFMYGVIAKTKDEARERVMLPAKLLLLTRPRILEAMGYEPPTYDFEMTFNLVFPRDAQRWLEEAKKLPDEVVEKSPIVYGTVDDFIERFEQYYKVGCRHFVMNFQVSPKYLKDCLDLYKQVAEYFRENYS
ncbi:LLM class flavin-dependent oxidoreductase [Ferroglobus sp.]|uniref:LLM class flavin-dependent oxidoreductase n=1 Tax=Ferroglobus sp. TaxID=2614230 RepID=UPI0025B8028D|nr:LLM class flavin-dependent oxidoreductase [Ferroglobus sp.]